MSLDRDKPFRATSIILKESSSVVDQGGQREEATSFQASKGWVVEVHERRRIVRVWNAHRSRVAQDGAVVTTIPFENVCSYQPEGDVEHAAEAKKAAAVLA